MNKKILKILNSSYFWLLFFLLASIVYFWHFLMHPAFNLIDDGMTLKISREILSGNFNSLIEIESGRIRPFYWIYFSLIYLLSGNYPIGYWFGQTLMFSLSLFSIWYLIRIEPKNNKWIKYFYGFPLLILFFVPAISENLCRLGTAEVRQMLFIILFMIWMVKNTMGRLQEWIGLLFFFLATLTKETSLMLLPMFFIYIIPFLLTNFKKYRKQLWTLLLFSFFSLAFFLLGIALKENSEYSSNFSINWPQIKYNILISRHTMREIYYLLTIFLSFTLARIILYFKNKKTFYKKEKSYILKILINFWKKNSILIAVLTGLFVSLFFVFSWQYQLNRYYYPVFIFLFIYMLLELNSLIFVFFDSSPKEKILLITLPIIVGLSSYFTVFQMVSPNYLKYISENRIVKRRWFVEYQNSYSIIGYLLKTNYQVIYTLIDDLEVVHELSLFANKLDFNKSRIESYSTNKEAAENSKYINYSTRVVNDFVQDQRQNKILITVNSKPAHLDETVYKKEKISNSLLKQYSDRDGWVIWRENVFEKRK